MKRNEILRKLVFSVPEIKKKRVIIMSDIKCEADDPYAIVHQLLTPCLEIKGIIATHFEWRYIHIEELKNQRGTSMEQSYYEGMRILKLMEIEDVYLFKGSKYELMNQDNLPLSPGADFIIEEAMKKDNKPLYVTVQGALTDIAIAYLKEPSIADKLTVVFVGGGRYPKGGDEMNVKNDLLSAQIVFNSPIKLWQIPINVYSTLEVSITELIHNVKPYGKIGEYLYNQLIEVNEFYGSIPIRLPFPHGESWVLGDNSIVSVLLQNENRMCWHIEKAPKINDDLTYFPNPEGKEIKVFDVIDSRMTINDLFLKLKICYGDEVR